MYYYYAHVCEHVCVLLCEHMCVFERTSAVVIQKILYEASSWNSEAVDC